MFAFLWLFVFFIPRIHSYANAIGAIHDFQLVVATATPQFMSLVQSVYAMVPNKDDITPVLSKDVAIALDALRQAAVPMSVNTAISITISDFVAGVVGGAVSRGTANLLGDKKKDSLQTKVGSTGAFFGTRAAVRGIARIIGLPRPLALLCSSVVASVVSEAAKGIGRAKTDEEDPTCPTEEQGLKGSEISGDISKWLIFDLLEEKAKEIYPIDEYFNELLVVTFAVGFVAGIGGLGVKQAIENRASTNELDKDNPAKAGLFDESNLPKLLATGIEGGVLFASFQLVLKIVGMVVPKGMIMSYLIDELTHSNLSPSPFPHNVSLLSQNLDLTSITITTT